MQGKGSFVRGDICEPSSLHAAVNGAEVVYHLAALLHMPHDACILDFRKVNVEGTQNFLEFEEELGLTPIKFNEGIAETINQMETRRTQKLSNK